MPVKQALLRWSHPSSQLEYLNAVAVKKVNPQRGLLDCTMSAVQSKGRPVGLQPQQLKEGDLGSAVTNALPAIVLNQLSRDKAPLVPHTAQGNYEITINSVRKELCRNANRSTDGSAVTVAPE